MARVSLKMAFEESPDTEVPGEDSAREFSGRMERHNCEVSSIDLHGDYAWSWVVKCESAAYYFILGGLVEGRLSALGLEDTLDVGL